MIGRGRRQTTSRRASSEKSLTRRGYSIGNTLFLHSSSSAASRNSKSISPWWNLNCTGPPRSYPMNLEPEMFCAVHCAHPKVPNSSSCTLTMNVGARLDRASKRQSVASNLILSCNPAVRVMIGTMWSTTASARARAAAFAPANTSGNLASTKPKWQSRAKCRDSRQTKM